MGLSRTGRSRGCAVHSGPYRNETFEEKADSSSSCGGLLKVFPAGSDIRDAAGHALVTSYALLRPDGQWSLMIVNKDQENAHSVRIAFDGAGKNASYFSGPVSMVTFGSEQYQWHSKINGGMADPDGPPARSAINGDASTMYTLPKASVTVLRGRLAENPAK